METNELYPVFLKVATLNTLIVGGGNVALEKLTFLLKSSPKAKVTLVAKNVTDAIIQMAKDHDITIIKEPYKADYLSGKHLVIATTDDIKINLEVYNDCKARNILVNVADNPPYCDFYMGGIVTKGNIKLAISTNGKSPTTAKRLRQFFEEIIPDDINELVENLNNYRQSLKGDFQHKVKKLNELTKGLLSKED